MIEDRIYQWDEIYPDDKILLEDILRGEMYLLEAEGRLAACIVLNEEQDDLYRTGSWRFTGQRVAVIHRLCVHPKFQGAGDRKEKPCGWRKRWRRRTVTA